jgi:hypothetical protein
MDAQRVPDLEQVPPEGVFEASVDAATALCRCGSARSLPAEPS